MINPIIFTLQITPNFSFTLRWYGILVMAGVVVASWLAEKEIRRRGEDGTHIWNLLVWLLVAGVVGARLWYVAQSILAGNPYYLQNPQQILAIWQGGLHFYGAILFWHDCTDHLCALLQTGSLVDAGCHRAHVADRSGHRSAS